MHRSEIFPLMSVQGHKPRKAAEAVRPCTSAALPKADVNSRHGFRRLVPNPDSCTAAKDTGGHSITSSTAASSVGEMSRPRALAVVRFTTRSNLIGCSTGMSPGFVPRRILVDKLSRTSPQVR